MFDFEFQRPSALAALVLPIALWLLARRPRPPIAAATGTLAIWHEVLEQMTARPTTRKRGLPLGLLFLLLALTLGSLALAGPVQRAESAAPWRVVLDTRPQMFLPWSLTADRTSDQRRIDVALESAAQWIDGETLWMRFDGEEWEESRGSDPPADWLIAANLVMDELPWSEVDRADCLWITDRIPKPSAASFSASGGSAVDGWVGRRNGHRLFARGSELFESAEVDRARLFVADAVPRELRALTEAWSRERDVDLVGVEDAADLRLSVTQRGDGESSVFGTDWTLRGATCAEPTGRVIWRDEVGATVLAGTPGELRLALRDPVEWGGDRRRFGLAWIEILESHVRSPAGAVSLTGRRDAGPAGLGLGPEAPLAASRPARLVSWMIAAAALAAALGLRSRALRV